MHLNDNNQVKSRVVHHTHTHDVRGSVYHNTLLTVKKPKKMQQFIKILLFLILNKAQHVSGDT
jgi:hypothetical protein